jgi:hypothetical protein
LEVNKGNTTRSIGLQIELDAWCCQHCNWSYCGTAASSKTKNAADASANACLWDSAVVPSETTDSSCHTIDDALASLYDDDEMRVTSSYVPEIPSDWLLDDPYFLNRSTTRTRTISANISTTLVG